MPPVFQDPNPIPPLATGRTPETSEVILTVVLVVRAPVPPGLLTNPAENVAAPVPPLATGKVPLTWVVRPTLPYDGAVLTPPEIRTLPVAISASLVSDVMVSA